MVERTKIAALFALGSVVALLVAVLAIRLLEYVGINPLLVAWLGASVFALVWIYDAVTEQPS